MDEKVGGWIGMKAGGSAGGQIFVNGCVDQQTSAWVSGWMSWLVVLRASWWEGRRWAGE